MKTFVILASWMGEWTSARKLDYYSRQFVSDFQRYIHTYLYTKKIML